MIDQKTEIIINKKIAEGTYLLGLNAHKIVSTAKPGQFVMIRLTSENDPFLRRPFSISGIREDCLFIIYRVVGQGTRILSSLQKGEYIQTLGPLGKGFAIPRFDQKAVLVAGGLGIAPLVFLAQKIDPDRLDFLAGFRSAKDVVDIRVLGLKDVGLTLATDDHSLGQGGTVTKILEDLLLKPGQSAPIVFSCGPLLMLKQVVKITKKFRIECQVSLESSMACGVGACQGCAIKSASSYGTSYLHVCKDGPVFRSEALDWNKYDLKKT